MPEILAAADLLDSKSDCVFFRVFSEEPALLVDLIATKRGQFYFQPCPTTTVRWGQALNNERGLVNPCAIGSMRSREAGVGAQGNRIRPF